MWHYLNQLGSHSCTHARMAAFINMMLIKWFPQVIAGALITWSWGKQTAAAEDVCQHAGESSSYKYGLYSTLPKIIAARTMPPETLPDAKIARWVQGAGPIYHNQTINICSCCTQKQSATRPVRIHTELLIFGKKLPRIISAGSRILTQDCVFHFNIIFLSMGKLSKVVLSYLKTYKNSKQKIIIKEKSTNRGRSCPTACQRQTITFLIYLK